VLLAEATTDSLQLSAIAMGLMGGLSLFLFDLDQMSSGLKLIAGTGMKKVPLCRTNVLITFPASYNRQSTGRHDDVA
jgi:hypothetical protein